MVKTYLQNDLRMYENDVEKYSGMKYIAKQVQYRKTKEKSNSK